MTDGARRSGATGVARGLGSSAESVGRIEDWWSSSDPQRARVLAAAKARRSAPPPLRGADGLDAGSAHARPASCLTMTKSRRPLPGGVTPSRMTERGLDIGNASRSVPESATIWCCSTQVTRKENGMQLKTTQVRNLYNCQHFDGRVPEHANRRPCAEPASRPSAPCSGGGAERSAWTPVSTRARYWPDDAVR